MKIITNNKPKDSATNNSYIIIVTDKDDIEKLKEIINKNF
jgi:hypothetical protein